MGLIRCYRAILSEIGVRMEDVLSHRNPDEDAVIRERFEQGVIQFENEDYAAAAKACKAIWKRAPDNLGVLTLCMLPNRFRHRVNENNNEK